MTIYGLKPQNASVSLDYFLFYLTLYFYVFHFFVFLEKRDIKVKQNYIFSLFFLNIFSHVFNKSELQKSN